MTPTPIRARVLLVEDDPSQARLYQQAFPECRFTWVRRASEAVAALESEPPEVILLDHILEGGETGLAVLPALKRLAAHVPVIVVSGTLAIAEQIHALSGPQSAHYVIEKPVDLDVLESTLATALRDCGLGEAVAALRSLERAELIESGERERLFTERLARQHELAKQLRGSTSKPNLSQLAQEFAVDRRSIRRDLQDLVSRGQLPPEILGRDDEV
ncbi:MAG: response regulator [Verrucomicrobium sp.]|jgi:DNA-binding NtrC family response regulator|nr:response regulator [Verrucomicrobium sp.]